MRALRIAFAIIASLALAVACGLFRPSVEEERNFAPEFQKAVEARYPVIENAEVRAYVRSIGNRLLGCIDNPGLDYSFTPLWSDTVNAFAGVGGKTFVFSGLMLEADTEEELAGVVGHEIGHVVARHIADAIDREQTLNLGLAALVIATNEPGYADVGQLVGGLALLKFGRDAETEADEIGVRLLHCAGYDPEGLAVFFEKLMALERKQGAPPTFLSSHPATAERVAHVRALAAAEGAAEYMRTDPTRHRRIRELLRTLPKPPASKPAAR